MTASRPKKTWGTDFGRGVCKMDSDIYEINSCQKPETKNNGLTVHCFVDPIGNAAEINIFTKCGRRGGRSLNMREYRHTSNLTVHRIMIKQHNDRSLGRWRSCEFRDLPGILPQIWRYVVVGIYSVGCIAFAATRTRVKKIICQSKK